jgi:hypothetical protein
MIRYDALITFIRTWLTPLNRSLTSSALRTGQPTFARSLRRSMSSFKVYVSTSRQGVWDCQRARAEAGPSRMVSHFSRARTAFGPEMEGRARSRRRVDSRRPSPPSSRLGSSSSQHARATGCTARSGCTRVVSSERPSREEDGGLVERSRTELRRTVARPAVILPLVASCVSLLDLGPPFHKPSHSLPSVSSPLFHLVPPPPALPHPVGARLITP